MVIKWQSGFKASFSIAGQAKTIKDGFCGHDRTGRELINSLFGHNRTDIELRDGLSGHDRTG